MSHYIGSGTSLRITSWLQGMAQRVSGCVRLWFDANCRGRRAQLLKTQDVNKSAHLQEFHKPGCKMNLYIMALSGRTVDTRLVLAFEAIMMIFFHGFNRKLQPTDRMRPIATWTLLDEIDRELANNNTSLKQSLQGVTGLNHALPTRQGCRFDKSVLMYHFCSESYKVSKGPSYIILFD